MHNLAPANAPWFEHLTDSVRALGETAREWQLADQKARLLETDVELLRRSLHEGKIAVHGPAAQGWDAKPRKRGPHEHAVFDLQKVYMEHRHLTRRNYEHAAMLFASGTAWAIARVQAGEQPERVLFPLDGDRLPAAGDYRIDGLGNYVGAQKISAAYEQVLSMDTAGGYAEDLAGRDYVADHEAAEMFRLAEHAEGLSGAAYAYGRLAEGALCFVLLGPKAEHRKQFAETRSQNVGAIDEFGAILAAGVQLVSGSWHPARPGDLVHIHYEAVGDLPAFGETYIVAIAGEPGDTVPGLMSLKLLAHTLPETIPGLDAEAASAMVGCFASEASDEPLYDAWYEAGPQRLTIVRDGRPVHVGGAR